MKRPYLLKKRDKFWYYRLAGETTFHSSGDTNRERVENWLQNVKIPESKAEVVSLDVTVREYLEPYFTPTCPHVARLRDENKAISDRYIKDNRARMVKHIFPDSICSKSFTDLKRADIIDFRSRMVVAEVGSRTVNRTIGILKIACKEAYFREDVERDPTAGIGEVKYEKQRTGVFSAEELKALFKERPGVWGDLNAYTAFILAAHSGMRRGEILELL